MSFVNCCAVDPSTGYCQKCRSFPDFDRREGLVCDELVKDVRLYNQDSGDYEYDEVGQNQKAVYTLGQMLALEQPEKFGMLD